MADASQRNSHRDAPLPDAHECSSKPTAVRQLGQRFIGALVILAVLASIEFYVILSQAQLLRNSALVRDLSGQQRSRVSRMGILVVDILGEQNPVERDAKHEQLRRELDAYRTAHARLLHGSPELDLPAPPERVRQVLFDEPMELARRVDAYISWYEEVLQVPQAQLHGHPTLTRFRAEAIGDKLLDGLEALVAAWQTENEEQLGHMQATAYGGLSATFLTLIVTGLFVFAPLVRRVKTETEKLSVANQLLNAQTRQLELENERRSVMNAKLQESEKRLELALHSSLDAVITINEQGTVTNWSPQAERIFGWNFQEAYGRPIQEMIIPSRYREAHGRGIGEFLRGGYAPALNRRLELFATRRNGEEFPVELSISPLRLQQGFEFCAFLRDITVRRETEQALKSLNETLEQRVAQRSGFVKLLQDVAVIANETESVEEALQAALDLISRYMHWPVGQAFLPDAQKPGQFRHAQLWSSSVGATNGIASFREHSATVRFRAGEGSLGTVITTRKPSWIADIAEGDGSTSAEHLRRMGLTAAIAFPILAGREVVAVLEFFCERLQDPDESLLEVLAHVGTQLGRVIERRRFQEQLMDAVWQQQRQLGQELHDSLGQELTGLAMMAEGLLQRIRDHGPSEAARMTELIHHLRKAQGQVRSLARGLFPVDVAADGLQAALAELTMHVKQQGRVDCEFDCPTSIRIRDDQIATHLFRITQEAVHNAVKHAEARRIQVRLANENAKLVLLIRDDGCGFDPSRHDASGMGLRIMRYRADAIGAQLQVSRAELGGTIIQCSVPGMAISA